MRAIISGSGPSLQFQLQPRCSDPRISRPEASCGVSSNLTHSGSRPPSIDALRKVHSPRMLAISDQSRFREREIWNVTLGLFGQLKPDVGGPDHFDPLLGVHGDELDEFGGRALQR